MINKKKIITASLSIFLCLISFSNPKFCLFQVKVGDKECEIMDGFFLYITTKMPNPSYTPEVSQQIGNQALYEIIYIYFLLLFSYLVHNEYGIYSDVF